MTATKILIAGLTLTVLGELSPAEEIWLAENSRKKQLISMKNRYSVVKALAENKHIQKVAETEEEAELLALTIMQTPTQDQTPKDRAALELIYLKMAESNSLPDESQDDELEFLTFIIQSRSNKTNWTYRKTQLLGREKQQALWEFINSEMAGKSPDESVLDPLEPNSETSVEQPTATPEMSVITG